MNSKSKQSDIKRWGIAILAIGGLLMAISTSSFAATASSPMEANLKTKEFYKGYEKASKAYKAGDYEKAFKLSHESAKEGNKHSQYMLGLMYLEGMGTEQDYGRAYIWLGVAAEADNKDWRNAYKKLGEAFPEQDRAQLDEFVAEYTDKYGMKAMDIYCGKMKPLGSHLIQYTCKKRVTYIQ